MRKLAAASTGFVCSSSGDSECTQQWQHPTSWLKQSGPNNCLTNDTTWQCNVTARSNRPSHGRCNCLKHRFAILRPQALSEGWRYTETCPRAWPAWAWALGPRDGSCIWLISVVFGCSRMKLRCTTTQQWMATLRPQWKVEVLFKYTETWQRAWAPWTRDALPSWSELESGQKELRCWQSGP